MAYPCLIVGVAVLLVTSAAPTAALAHSEGVEAADPNTPPAVLTFDGAAARYTSLRTARANWRGRFSSDARPTADHTEHAGAGQQTPTQHH